MDQTLVTATRDATTVPGQALYLLNAPFVRKQSLALAERLLADAKATDAARLASAYRLVLGRAPTAKETERAAAEKRGIHIVLKPHGGGSGASEEILRCIEKVAHANFKIWYDAGNIIYYTGKDPLAELEPIAKHVTGLCAKDCPGEKGQVMSQFGTGKVDFKALFAKLKAAGFNGPIMVEGVKVGATAGETTANARANREFLETALAAI